MRSGPKDPGSLLFRAAFACGLIVLLLSTQSAAEAAPAQLVANPYFSVWAGAAPDGWTPSGGAIVSASNDSYDAVRSGPNQAAVIRGGSDGDGLVQRAIPVTPGARYDIYAWTRAPGSGPGGEFQLRVSGDTGAQYLAVPAYSAALPGGWHRLQATFVAGPFESGLEVAFVRAGNANVVLELWVDDVVLWERLPDTSASLVPRPARPIVLYGPEQNIDRPADAVTMATFNVFDAYYHTPQFVSTLRAQGKVAAKRVYVADVPLEELVARWTEPFRDTMEGRLPQGFDAIVIDEFGGWSDGTAKARTVADALERTRALYPNRQIYVWGDWTLGLGSNHDRVLSAINSYADVFILEAYAHELLPQYELPGILANNIERRGQANRAVAGLMHKTVFGLAAYQASDSYTGDNSADIDFKAFLDEHFNRIANHAVAGQTSGVGLFAHQYTPPDTLAWFNALVRHYIGQGQRGYFGQGRQGETPLGRHASLLADRNPGFETPGTAWTMTGNASYITYASVPAVPPYHGATRSPVPHGSSLVQMQKGQPPGNDIRQLVPVQPATTYVFNAYARGGPGTSVEVSVRDAGPVSAFEQSAAFPGVTGDVWTKVGVVFTTPAGVNLVELRLSDAPAAAGSVTYWDYAELTVKRTFDTFTPTVTADVTSLTIDWVTDIPTTGSVIYADSSDTEQTVPAATGVTTRHRVVLTGLTPGTQYEFRTVNRTGTSPAATYTSPGHAAFTRSSTGPVPDASPIPPDVVPPDPPAGLVAAAREAGVALDWDDNEYDVVGYDVYRADTPDGELVKVNSSLIRDSTYLDEGAHPTSRYTYAVRAIDAAGNESEFSERVTSLLERSRVLIPLIAKD